MRRIILLYLAALSIPAFLGLGAWQSSRYAGLERELKRLEAAQEEWIESNKRLIAAIAVLSSPERIEHIARNDLELRKIPPEEVLLIRIEGENGLDL
ncbi:MAG: septum formation initiator family protein [Treponema sp.]|jgi:cell division protein FtsL|nr:septum formation initiator family protein [Treponema sp.]